MCGLPRTHRYIKFVGMVSRVFPALYRFSWVERGYRAVSRIYVETER